MFDDGNYNDTPSYKCNKCSGSIQQNIVTGKWECQGCDFVADSDEAAHDE